MTAIALAAGLAAAPDRSDLFGRPLAIPATPDGLGTVVGRLLLALVPVSALLALFAGG